MKPTRISKALWERLGGMENPKLFRRRRSNAWQYYRS
jgi:hypothetical protein